MTPLTVSERGSRWLSLGALVIAPCAGYVLLHVAGRKYPATFWGVDQLSYYPGWFSVVFLSIAAAAILIAAVPGLYEPLAAFFTRAARPIPLAAALKAFCLILFLLLAYGFRDQHHHLGDSDLLFNNLDHAMTEEGRQRLAWIRGIPLEGWEFIPLFEPLDFFLHLKVYDIGSTLAGFEPKDAYETVSCAAGLLFVVCLWKISCLLGRRREEQMPLFLFLITLGSLQLFFGYGESYTLVTLASCWYVLAALRSLRGGGVAWPALALALSASLHAMALCLVPSFLFLVWRKHRSARIEALLARRIPRIAVPVAIVAAWVLYSKIYPHSLPLFADTDKGTYGLLSPGHLLFLLNAALLVSPFGLIWAGAFTLSRRETDPDVRFLRWSALGPLVLMFAHDAYLGGRDWDLMSFPGLFCALWGFSCMAKAGGFSAARAAAAIVPVMGMHTALWVGINCDPEKALERLGNLVTVTNQGPHYTAFTQGFYYQSHRKEPLMAASFFQEAIALTPTSDQKRKVRYYKHLGQVLIEAGLYEEAAAAFESAFSKQSQPIILNQDVKNQSLWAVAALQVGEAYAEQGEYERALKVWNAASDRLSEVVKTFPSGPVYRLLGKLHHEAGRQEKAVSSYRLSLELENDPDEQYKTFIFLAEAHQGEPAGTREALEQALELKPTASKVHFYLGNISYTEGNRDIAADYYRTAIRLDSNGVKYYSRLGSVLEESGRLSEARDVYRTALEKAPGDAGLKERLARVKRVLSQSP